MNNSRVVTHDFPVWRDKADFIITSRIGEELGLEDYFDWEQLWGRKIGDNTFELCCIPFFVYGFALGDLVETQPYRDKNFVVNRLVVPGGQKCYRLYFQVLDRWNGIIDDLLQIGCNVEARWRMSQLIAVCIPNERHSVLEKYMENVSHELTWENGN